MKSLYHAMTKLAVTWIADANKEIMGDKKYPMSSFTSEVEELGDAIRNMDRDNLHEELHDVAWTGQAMLHQNTGLNFPLVAGHPSLEKYRERDRVWHDIMDRFGIEHHSDYLSGGSNFRKPRKIVAALGLAGKDITEQEALDVLTALGYDPEEVDALDEINSGVRHLYPHVDHDVNSRQEDLLDKLEDLQTAEDDGKAAADVYISSLWLEDTDPDSKEVAQQAREVALQHVDAARIRERWKELQGRLDNTGTLYRH